MPLAADPQNPLLAVPVMAGIALVVAFVTFRWLSSTGRAKTHYGELGGAAAGFVVTFGVLTGAYYSLEPRWARTHDLKEQVARQQRVIESSKVPTGFSVPASYTPVLDRTHGLAYGYPSRWQKAYSLETFEQDPLSISPHARPVNLVVVAQPVQRKTYSVAQVYQAARESGIATANVKDQLGVALNSKTARLQVSLKDVLAVLGAHGSSAREAIYDSSFRLLRASFPGTFVRRDDRMIDGVPSLDVEHRGRGGAGGLLQFLVATYVPQRAAVISMTFTSTAGNRQTLNDIRERVIGTLKFLPAANR
jgi:hypothetical protein